MAAPKWVVVRLTSRTATEIRENLSSSPAQSEEYRKQVSHTMATKFKVAEHILVPKHTKLSEKEKADLLAKYAVTENELPRMSIKDAALQSMSVKQGDVVKIERNSLTAGTTVFYRRVS